MKIKKLRIQNFRGLSDVHFDFDQPTNVIVGPNAIGKTTILESIRLVKALLMPLCWFSGNWTKPVYHKRQAIPSGDYFDEFF